jgi:hypothetical protein
MREGIRRFNASKRIPDGLEHGYHETLTVAWVRILDAVTRTHGPEADACAFLAKHAELRDKTLLRRHYSRGRLVTWEAKRRFVEPDLAPLPAAGGAPDARAAP